MYKAFFSLTRNPFELTPDPAFLFSTKRHNEALAALYHGVRRHKGFVVMTGEVGTGKTLLLRCLLRLLKQSKDVTYAYLFNSRLASTEFLEYILADFGLSTHGKNKGELLFEFSRFLISRESNKLTTVLIVDEAHHLSTDILEEVRLLTNLETDENKMLQIILSGQPELDGKLDSVGLRQLKQRIAIRARLDPLEQDETRGYIEQRLKIAGLSGESTAVFDAQAIAAVHRYSRGVPRLINTICENALINAYARQNRSVTPDIVAEVAKDLRLDLADKLESEQCCGDREPDIRRGPGALLNLYSMSKSDVGAQEALQVNENEPYI
jgi:general secretion pathway protein A